MPRDDMPQPKPRTDHTNHPDPFTKPWSRWQDRLIFVVVCITSGLVTGAGSVWVVGQFVCK